MESYERGFKRIRLLILNFSNSVTLHLSHSVTSNLSDQGCIRPLRDSARSRAMSRDIGHVRLAD